MTRRLRALTPVLLVAIVLTSASTLTFAAVRSGKPASRPAPAAKTRKLVVVPAVQGEAYVFAKGILEDAGFAWSVRGSVQGYATNVVTGQSPAAGTILVDTGAPTVKLSLQRNVSYREVGTPDDSAPYAGTRVLLPGAAAEAAKRSAARRAFHPAAKPDSAPTSSAPASKPRPVSKSRPVSKPAAAVPTNFAGGKLPRSRPPAFVAQGAPGEPLDEMPLPDRAQLLARWVEQHPARTDPEVKHWLYQHAWLVYGAKFGWWHGAEALQTLIHVDQRVQQLWGIGADSEASARAALAFVSQRTR